MAAYEVSGAGHIKVNAGTMLDGKKVRATDRVAVFDERDGRNWCEAVVIPRGDGFSVSALPPGARVVGLLKIREFDAFGLIVDACVLMQARPFTSYFPFSFVPTV